MLQHLGAVEHGPVLLGPLLETTESLLDVARFDGDLALARGVEETLLALALLIARVIGAALGAGHVLLFLDLEGDLGEGLDHLEGQEAEDVDDVVRRLAIRDDAEAGPLAEALALAPGEGGLAVLGPGDVLLLGHDLCALVGLAQPLERDVVHLLLLFVLLVIALGHLDGVEGSRLPRQPDLGLFVLLGRVVDGPAADDAAGVIAPRKVGVGALVVRVLDVLPDILPREERPQGGRPWPGRA